MHVERGEITEQSFLERLALLREHRQRLIAQREHLDQMLAAVNQKIGLYEQQVADQQAKKRREALMKAVVVPRFGGPEVPETRDMPIPQPGPGQVLIQVAYAGVNNIDLWSRQGRHRPALPFIPGYEVAGTIRALGEGVEGFRAGQDVSALTVGGGYAEFVLAQAVLTFPLDTFTSKIDLQQAAVFPTVVLTAYGTLTQAARMREGERVLIHSASGGGAWQQGKLRGPWERNSCWAPSATKRTLPLLAHLDTTRSSRSMGSSGP